MKPWTIPAIGALAFALAAPVSAELIYRNMVNQRFTAGASAAGWVTASGQVSRGTGFTVNHRGKGEYHIDFEGHFGPEGCASMVVTGVQTPILAIAFPRVCSPHTAFLVEISNPATGQPEDADFQFIASQQYFYK